MSEVIITTERQFWYWFQMGKRIKAIINENKVEFFESSELYTNNSLCCYSVGSVIFVTNKEDMESYIQKLLKTDNPVWVET
jgi:hypothetical protein